MNIFFLSWIIENCIQYHCNKHIVKMILETTQLLSTTQHVANPDQAKTWQAEGKIYRPTHINHPSTIWTRECKENYIWLCHLGLGLCNEYAYRYDKKPTDHKCYDKLMFLITHVPPLPDNNGVITMPKMAMPDQYKSEDPVKSYRKYYLNDKVRMLAWGKRGPPHWVPKELQYVHYDTEIKRLTTELSKLISRVRKTPEHNNKINELKEEIAKLNSLKL